MILRCQDALERLVEGLTGSVPPAARAVLVEHLAVCPRCRDAAARLEPVVERLREAGRIGAPPGFWPAFMSGLQARIAAERAPRWRRLGGWLARPRVAVATAAATAATVLLITTAARHLPRPAVEADPLARAGGIVTETMTSTLPSLGQMLDIWRAGMTADGDPPLNGADRRR